MKVLVVEGSPILRERLVEMLSEIQGVRAFGQHTEKEETILQMLLQLKPDALVFDAQISGVNSVAMLRKIRQGVHLPKIFIFSNIENDAYREKYLKMGANYFFDKTTGLKEMINKFSELVGQMPHNRSF